MRSIIVEMFGGNVALSYASNSAKVRQKCLENRYRGKFKLRIKAATFDTQPQNEIDLNIDLNIYLFIYLFKYFKIPQRPTWRPI